MKSSILSEKAKQLKEDSKGGQKMSRIMRELIEEERMEAQLETAAKLIGQDIMKEDRIKDFFGFTDEQMKHVKEQAAAFA